MGIEAVVALVGGIIALLTVILKLRTNRKANRNEIGKVESAELGAGMDAVDKLQSPPK